MKLPITITINYDWSVIGLWSVSGISKHRVTKCLDCSTSKGHWFPYFAFRKPAHLAILWLKLAIRCSDKVAWNIAIRRLFYSRLGYVNGWSFICLSSSLQIKWAEAANRYCCLKAVFMPYHSRILYIPAYFLWTPKWRWYCFQSKRYFLFNFT